MQSTLPFDICQNRHKNNPQSVEVNKTIDKAAWRQKICAYAETVKDFTLNEMCRHFGKEKNCLSGRLSEMKMAGLLEDTGNTRERCAVLRLVK